MLTFQSLPIPFLAAAAVSCMLLTSVLTGAFRKFAISKGRLDVPNERSMHTAPVPRGGGIAIVIVFFLAILCLAALRGDMWLLAGALVFPGALVAAIGWIDDRSHVPASLRLLVHLAACAIAVGFVVDAAWPQSGFYWMLPAPHFLSHAFRALTKAEYVSAFLGVIGCAYLLNLYNFMDGLDGLAAGQGAFAGLTGGALILAMESQYWWYQYPPKGPISGLPFYHAQAAAVCAILLAVCCMGFLIWNLPPAKIFMGDVGSGFIGFAFAIIIFTCAWIDLSLLWPWLILLATFIADATYTLGVRILTRQRFFEAHRLHTFQKLALRWKSHKKVTVAFLIVDIAWLLPLAYLSLSSRALAPLLTAIAYVPLLAIAALTGAGLNDETLLSAVKPSDQRKGLGAGPGGPA